MLNSLFADFCTFSKAQLASTDIDPAYPVLKWRCVTDGCTPEQTLWRLLLYVTYYHLGSAERWWKREPNPTFAAVDQLEASATGVERRGMRGNTRLVRRFVRDALETGLLSGVPRLPAGEPGWAAARAGMERCAGGGPWASYKWADLLKHVYGAPITANDIGIGGGGKNAGPVPGLAKLTGRPWEECATDVMLQHSLYQDAVAAGVPFNGLDQLETCLCDFCSLTKGSYYVGNDIDMMMSQLEPWSNLWEARKAVIPRNYLGELNGWSTAEKERRKVYAETGEVITR